MGSHTHQKLSHFDLYSPFFMIFHLEIFGHFYPLWGTKGPNMGSRRVNRQSWQFFSGVLIWGPIHAKYLRKPIRSRGDILMGGFCAQIGIALPTAPHVFIFQNDAYWLNPSKIISIFFYFQQKYEFHIFGYLHKQNGVFPIIKL